MAGNDVIYGQLASDPLGISDETQLSRRKLSNIMRETLAHKSIYDHLTWMTTVDEIINVNASKVPWKAKN